MCSVPNWVNSLATGLRSISPKSFSSWKHRAGKEKWRHHSLGAWVRQQSHAVLYTGLTCRSGMANNIPNNPRQMHGDGTSRLFFSKVIHSVLQQGQKHHREDKSLSHCHNVSHWHIMSVLYWSTNIMRHYCAQFFIRVCWLVVRAHSTT